MLREDKNVSQVSGEPPRRWFSDQEFDLIVFGELQTGEWQGFQLCYDKPNLERALTWSLGKGFGHFHVDTGEMGPLKSMAPMMGRKGELDLVGLRTQFTVQSAKIDPLVRDFVLKKMDEFLPER